MCSFLKQNVQKFRYNHTLSRFTGDTDKQKLHLLINLIFSPNT